MSYIPRGQEWDRQPTEFVRLRAELPRSMEFVHALMPGLQDPRQLWDYARPFAPNPTITGTRGDFTSRVTPRGMALQLHPFSSNESGDTPSNNSVKTIRFPQIINPDDDLTVLWFGFIDTPGPANGNEGYGALWALGADGAGNGWGARQLALASGNLAGYYIDTVPSQKQTNLAIPGGIYAGLYIAAGYQKLGASGSVTVFDGVNGLSATTVQGTGTMRSSTVGFDLGGSGQNAQGEGLPGGWFVTGHNRCLASCVIRGRPSAEWMFRALSLPWWVWAREPAPLFMPMAISAGQNGTAPGAIWAMRLGFAPGAPSASATAPGASLPASLALTPGAGQAASTATGATLPVGLALVPGATRADSTAAGATLPMAVSWSPGAASGSGSATAPGTSWPASLALMPGQASASSLAAGASWPVGLAWAPGAASGSGAGTAPGATWAVGLGWLPGAASATGQGTAPGAKWPMGLSLVAGAGQASSSAAGAVLSMSAGWIPGAASASSGVTAPGAIWPLGLSLSAGAASASSVAAGAVWAMRIDWIPGQASSQGADFTHHRLFVVAPERRSYRIAPGNRAYRIKP